ncbi:hypothetical protein [Methylosinus sp. Ce-a6]|uniref:hypothetical protein n=1 Tax=Methylosinus sp. Ce-a6 TaxID=2172005 RepID=UPI00135B7562|nr:hypothetical protein [Methylosinus sp. Ce-a6]
MRIVVFVAAILSLQGCKSAEERAAQAREERERVIASARDVCAKFGHAVGSPVFSACVEKTFFEVTYAQEREAALAVARHAAFQESLSNDLGQIASNIKPAYQSGGSMRCSTYGQTANCNW